MRCGASQSGSRGSGGIASALRVGLELRRGSGEPACQCWEVAEALERGSHRPCPCQLQQVVGDTDEGPFVVDLIDAAQKKLSKASGGLDLAEDRLGGLLAQPIAAATWQT